MVFEENILSSRQFPYPLNYDIHKREESEHTQILFSGEGPLPWCHCWGMPLKSFGAPVTKKSCASLPEWNLERQQALWASPQQHGGEAIDMVEDCLPRGAWDTLTWSPKPRWAGSSWMLSWETKRWAQASNREDLRDFVVRSKQDPYVPMTHDLRPGGKEDISEDTIEGRQDQGPETHPDALQ